MDRAPATDAPSVFARLDSNAAARVARVEARRNDAKLDANPLEDAAKCVDAFERARREIEDALREALATMSVRDAADSVSGALGVKRRQVYQTAMRLASEGEKPERDA